VTLFESVIVLSIVVALAGLVVPRLMSTTQAARQTAAKASAVEIRDAVLQFWSDCKYAYPAGPVTQQRVQLGHLLAVPSIGSFATYDPEIGLGWNGPYLESDGGNYIVDAAAGFTTTYGDATQRAVRDAFINRDVDGNGVAETGSPFVIQEPTLRALAAASATYTIGEVREVRIVSAGPNGILEIDESRFAAELEADASLKGDDVYVAFTLR
jgi:type II secretory pathway pseudopilin PulG